MAQKIIDILAEKIINILEEINELENLIKNYNYLAQRMNTYVEVFLCEEDAYIQKNNNLRELKSIIDSIKKLTKTESFDYIENMQQYLKDNVDKKNWIKFSSLYASATNLLKNPDIYKQYESHAQLMESIEQDKNLSVKCIEQLPILLKLRDEKIAAYDTLNKEYIKQQAIEKNLKENNNRK